ncbi:hypothetical protein FJ950_21110 [Mesorhizobium sp. B2-3-14]|uniref:hypothetical protein n=1 Tax=Mesorhizobium sp. B2-3-14 TaxID=2589950 RepID=UPI00112E779B|nr:hypothetical protein [Mesorhizobium sp. B2-3-14]TPL82846.1 hypothetical protein FJ950_21110 [Mesorhizobium sp. B2-3-14]
MATEKIENPENFINSFSFHDVNLDRINIDFDIQTAELVTPDMNWNYEGRYGYVKRPCRLIFGCVTGYLINVTDLEGVRIDSMSANINEGYILANIKLNLGRGDFGSELDHISFKFKTLEVVDM